MGVLRDFMFERVYLGTAVRAEHAKIAGVVRGCSSTTSLTPSCCRAAAADGEERSSSRGGSPTTWRG